MTQADVTDPTLQVSDELTGGRFGGPLIVDSPESLARVLCMAGFHVAETHNGRPVGTDWICHFHRTQAEKKWWRFRGAYAEDDR